MLDDKEEEENENDLILEIHDSVIWKWLNFKE